ncbi:MAG: Minf_1886 family protein [Verrucomicrobiota bacterium]
MSKIPFEQAVNDAVHVDTRYSPDAYQFLRDALDYTIKTLQKSNPSAVSHVSGPELCQGLRDYALQQFGPMVPTIFEAWGLQTTRDMGEMVFNLIRTGAFSRSESDRVEDFENIYTFAEAFEKPYLPVRGLKPSPTRPL